MRTSQLLMALGALAVATTAAAAPTRDCSRNAALGYWMAMAEMKNPDVPEALAAQLERTARGELPWDDKLAPVVDANREALATMHRASAQPFCDWGLETSRDAETPVAHLVRARALARLNVLRGLQLVRHEQGVEAARTWAAGLRFSRDIAAGAPLLGALYASEQLRAHMKAIEAAAGRLPEAQRQELARALAALPEDGFDWGAVVELELGAVLALQQRLVSSTDPCAELQQLVAGGKGRADQDRAVAAYLGLPVERLGDPQAVRGALARGLAAMRTLQAQAVAAFRLPQQRSTPVVRELVQRAGADPTLAQGWPSLGRANDEARAGVAAARKSALAALAAADAPGAGRLHDVSSADVPLGAVLGRADEYVRRYQRAFDGVQAQETCRQWLRGDWTGSGYDNVRGSNAVGRSGNRTLRSEVAWGSAPGRPWCCFRDVIEVDGQALPGHGGRLAALLTNPSSAAAEKARAILDDAGTRFMGPSRDVNLPTHALAWLLSANQRRLALTRRGERVIAGRRGLEVEFREVTSPTLVRDRGADVASSGRFWIEPTTGAVLRSEIEFAGRGRVETEYRVEAAFDVMVPAVMRENGVGLDLAGAGAVETTARYSGYRRFGSAAARASAATPAQ